MIAIGGLSEEGLAQLGRDDRLLNFSCLAVHLQLQKLLAPYKIVKASRKIHMPGGNPLCKSYSSALSVTYKREALALPTSVPALSTCKAKRCCGLQDECVAILVAVHQDVFRPRGICP